MPKFKVTVICIRKVFEEGYYYLEADTADEALEWADSEPCPDIMNEVDSYTQRIDYEIESLFDTAPRPFVDITKDKPKCEPSES